MKNNEILNEIEWKLVVTDTIQRTEETPSKNEGNHF